MKIYKLSFLTLLIFISITNPSLTCDEPDGYGDMPASSSPTSAPVAASRSQTMTAGDALLELPPSFLQLGRDPSILVMRYLPLGDAISLSQTCKSLNRYFKNPLVQKRFGSPFNNDRELKDAFSRLGNIFRKKAGSIASALFTKTPHLYGHMLNRLLSCGRTFGFLQPMSALRMFLWGFANIELCEERKRSASFSSQLEDAFFKTPLEKLRPAISHTIGLYREYKFFGFNHGNTVQALGKLSPEQMSLLCRAAPKIFNQLLHTSNFGYGEDLTVSALCSIPFEVALKICDTEPSFLLGAIRKEKKVPIIRALGTLYPEEIPPLVEAIEINASRLFQDGMNSGNQFDVIAGLCSVKPDIISEVIERVEANVQGLFTDGMNGYQQASIIRALCSVSPDTVSQVVEQVRGNLQKILPRSDRLLFIAPLTGALCFIPPASIPTVCEYLPRISFKYRNAFDFAEVAKYLGQVAPDVIPQVVTLIQENSETDFLESDELEGLLSVPQEAIPPICQALRTYRRGYEPINKLIRALGAFSPNIISSLCEGDSSVLKYNRRQRGITEMLGALSLLEEERVLVVYQYAQEFCRNINFASGQTSEIIEILGSLSPVNAAAFFEEASSINKAGINPWDYIRRLRKLRSQYELERGE